MPPLVVTLRRTPFNRTSIAALLAVLEQELPDGLVEPRLATSKEQVEPSTGLVVLSLMSAQLTPTLAEIRWLRERRGAGLAIVAGGPHPATDPTGMLAAGVDWVAVGEAGSSFVELVRAIRRGERPPRGILGPDASQDLDRYPPWPRSGALFATLEISRGCPGRCAYCQVPVLHGHRMRHRSVAGLEPVFRQAVATGHSFTRFVSPNAFAYGSADGRMANPRALERLLRAARQSGLERVFLGSFPSEVRPETVTDETLALVRDLCANRGVVVGLQSGSDALLRRVGRGHSVEQGVEAVRRIARAGLRPLVDFIFGLPGETSEDRRLSLELIRRLSDEHGARINTHLFMPLAGTPLAGAPPGTVDAATRELLRELVGRGACWAFERAC